MNCEKRITVACVNTALHEVGGETRRLRNLYSHINGPKYRFLIAYCSRQKDAVEQFFLDGGVKKEDLFHFPTSKKAFFIPLIIRLRKLFIAEHVDIVHTFFLHSDILGFVSALLAGIKRRISNVEGKFVLDEEYGVGRIKQVCYFIINLIIRPHFYKTVVVSAELKDELVRYYGVQADKVEIINIGINVPSEKEINTDACNNEGKTQKVIANAARFSKDKGLEYFIRAIPCVVREIPEARFVLAGRGEEEGRLKQLAADLGVQSFISFPGWIKDMMKFMREMDVFAMTSIREGCPMTLMEALSFAKPAVAFDVPGPKEMISHGEDGILVEPFDVQKFGSAIVRVCKDLEYARVLGANGRRKAEAGFSVEIEAEKMKALYSELF